MALILCIETGTDVCSVGLSRDGEMMSVRQSDEGRDHAAKVGVFVSELLNENSILMDDIDAVAVGKGPGSYTGLRIGVSFAKGLCYGASKPLIGISSLESLAQVAINDISMGIIEPKEEQLLLCPMVDARRMEVYAQVFDNNLKALCEPKAEIVESGSFSTITSGRHMLIFGSGAKKCEGIIPGTEYAEVTPSASGMAQLAERAFNEGRFESTAYFEPFYLKDFIVTTSRKRLF